MKKGYLYIMLSALLFSTMEISLKLVSTQFNPIQMLFLRFLIGSLILVPLAVRDLNKRGATLCKDDFKFFALTGFICVVISMLFYQLAILYCKASTVAILFSCNPIFVIPLAHYILNEKIYNYTIISMIICAAGIILIMNPMNLADSAAGIVLVLLSAVTFALYSVIGRSKSLNYGGIVLNCFSFFMGSMELLAIILLSRTGFVTRLFTNIGLKTFADIPILRGITLSSIPALIYISVFVTGFGYVFYFMAMDETSVSAASLVFYIKPALAPVLSLIILKESIALNTIGGIVLIIIGSCVTLVLNAKKTKEVNAADVSAYDTELTK